MFKILVAENESSFAEEVVHLFASDNFEVQQARDGLKASQLINSCTFDAVIVDRRISKVSAYEICQQIRRSNTDAAVLVVHCENSVAEEELAISHGADQCLMHPVELRQLKARIHALLRRHHQPERYIRCSELVLDVETGLLTRNGEVINLRPMEFVLLEFFMKHPGCLFSCADLWLHVWRKKGPPSDSVRAHVSMLRKKLVSAGVPPIIKTVIGRGYIMES
jgi:DNA-binding response OmpR family regulator